MMDGKRADPVDLRIGHGSGDNPHQRNDGVFSLLGGIYLLILTVYLLSVMNQPCYHSGIRFTLHDEGFRVVRVAPGSNAYAAGLRAGMILTRVGTVDAPELSKISVRDLSLFLKISSGLFAKDSVLSVGTAGGEEFSFTIASLGVWGRISVMLEATFLNFMTGVLFIVAGMLLVRKGRIRREARWFTLFCFSAGTAIVFSNFHSYWTHELITFRFMLLDISVVAAGSSLYLFAKNFPEVRKINLPLFFIVFLFPLALKYLILFLAGLSPLGFTAYFIYPYLFGSLVSSIVVLIKQYRTVRSGGRRRLRWVLSGAVLSLTPYVLHTLLVVVKGDMLAFGFSILTIASNFGILLFPISVAIGVARFDLFDIDRFLRGLVTGGLYLSGVVVFYFLVNTPVEYFFPDFDRLLSYCAACLGAPFLFRFVLERSRPFFRRSLEEKVKALHKLENALTGLFRKELVYEEVAKGFSIIFTPSCLCLSFLTPEGYLNHEFQEKWGREGDEIADFLSSRERDRRPHALHHSGGGVSFALSGNAGVRGFLFCGRKLSGDYYTNDEMKLIRELCTKIMAAVENCNFYTRLKLAEENEMKAGKAALSDIVRLAEHRSREPGRHLERTSQYCRLLAGALMGQDDFSNYINTAYIEDLAFSCLFHDIGNLSIPDEVLSKPSKLTREEFDLVKNHSVVGGRLFEHAEQAVPGRSFLEPAKAVAYYHHERWDGTGYPEGRSGTAIPLGARIFAVADTYDALTTAKPYRNAFSHDEACRMILEESETHFDPQIVSVFWQMRDRFALERERFLRTP